MKKAVPFIIIAIVLILALVGAGFGTYMYHQKVRPDVDKKIDELANSNEYNAIFVSQFSTENIDFSKYKEFFDMDVASVYHDGCDEERLNIHLAKALEHKDSFQKIYLGLDYLLLEDGSMITESILQNSDIDWEIIISAECIDDIKECDNDLRTASIKKMLQSFRGMDNVKIISPIFDPGIIFNARNFDDNGLSKDLSVNYMLDDYLVTDGNLFFNTKKLLDFVDTFDKNSYPNFQDKTVIFFGDSIIANAGENDSIPAVVNYLSGATVHNYSIGGSTGSNYNDEKNLHNQIDSFIAESNQLSDKNDYFVGQTVFVINMGINDFFAAVPSRGSSEDTYEGAMVNGIKRLREECPGCEIIICEPTYLDYYEGEELTFGTEVMNDYRAAAKIIAEENDCRFLNNFVDLGINSDNCSDYYEDAVHFNVDGRLLYAENLLKRMKEWYGTN